MNKSRFFCLLILSATMTGCQSPHTSHSDEVVCETVHRYGVPLDPDDWSARGQDGRIVSMRKDGVTVTRSYEGGILQGECTYTFPYRDVIQAKEVYDQGALVEKFFYYSHGLPQKHISYGPSGPSQRQSVVIWYESKAPQCREEIIEDRLAQGEYYNSDHQLESRVDDFQGIRSCRDGAGQLQSKDTIQDGQMVLRTTYHPNGMPAATLPYAKGMVDGRLCTFLPGGEPATVEEWVQDARHGVTILFEHGEKWAEVPYVNGCKQGIERRYREGTTVVQEVTWIQGCRHGPTYSYIGNSMQTDWYFRDCPVPNRATFDMLSNQ